MGLIERRSLHGELFDRLYEMILDGVLKPGDKINEPELCKLFGVSRTPLREAIKVLASAGLLTLVPNRGASVARISPHEVDELFPIMGALEALAGELACERISNAEIAAIRKLTDKMTRSYEAGDAAQYARLNQSIHEAIFKAAGNAELHQFYQTMLVRTHSARFTARKSPERWREAVEDHRLILEALERRDGRTLAAVLREHLAHKAAGLHEFLADEGPAMLAAI
jgi:DNA-binding GntR family transcriptional regulator